MAPSARSLLHKKNYLHKLQEQWGRSCLRFWPGFSQSASLEPTPTRRGSTPTCWPTMTGLDELCEDCLWWLLLFRRLIRPVANNSDRLTVHMRLKLSQVIGVVSGPQLFSLLLLSLSSPVSRTCGARSWPLTCGCSRSGRTTSSPGTPRTTAGSSSSTCLVRTSGCRTLCSTISKEMLHNDSDAFLFKITESVHKWILM